MKTLYVSLVWLLMILVLWFVIYTFIIDRTISYYFKELDILYDKILNENYISAKENVENIKEHWGNSEKIWIYCVNQSEIEVIKTSIRNIEDSILTENQTMTLLEIEAFKMVLRLVRGNESLGLENIF